MPSIPQTPYQNKIPTQKNTPPIQKKHLLSFRSERSLLLKKRSLFREKRSLL